MGLPAVDMRRVYLIARRDFLGYIKTWGFWISFFLPFIFGAIAFFLTTLDLDVEPVRYEAILDQTGQHEAGIKSRIDAQYTQIEGKLIETVGQTLLSADELKAANSIHKSQGFAAVQAYMDTKYPGLGARLKVPPRKTLFVKAPGQTMADLQPFLKGEKPVSYEGASVDLDGVLHIRELESGLQIDYWSSNINNPRVKDVARRYFRDRATANYLKTGGLTPKGLSQARTERIKIESFDPTKAVTPGQGSQAVTMTDRIPYFVAAALCMMLWLSVFSGSYMLLTSMLEEKLNKLMEMMLATTRFSEIIFGKLIGVAALTIAAMFPYIIIGLVSVMAFIVMGPTEVAAGLTEAFTPKLIIFFFVFLVLGYLLYGALFIALGALAQSMQDAQTLTTPIMLILTSCVMVILPGINSPDSPLLTFAAWFPLSAPFAAIMRLPSDPPWWELTLQALFVLILSFLVIWIAGRVFRYGILSGAGVKGLKGWFMRKILRRPPA